MKIVESGQYTLITIEPTDWQYYGNRLLNTIKSIPGRVYIPYSKEWKIQTSRLHLLSEFLPTFTDQELAQGEIDCQNFLKQFDDDGNAYSL